MNTHLSHILQSLTSKPLPSIGTATGLSASGVVVTVESAVPVVQLIGGIIAILSGMVGLAIGAYHLKEIYLKERAKKLNLKEKKI